MKKKILIWGLLVPLYTLAFGEIYLRVFRPMPILPRFVKAMPYGIRGNSEDESYWHKTPEYKIHIRTNSRGIRSDQEFPYKKPANTKRIVLLGDSFAMGYGVDLRDTFSQKVVEILSQKTENRIELINLATSGHGNGEELITLKNEGLKYNPDLVLLSWHPSDLSDDVRSALYKIEDDKLVRNADTYLPGIEIRSFLFSIPGYRQLASHSHLYTFLREEAAVLAKAILLNKATTQENTGSYPRGTDATNLNLSILNEIYNLCSENEVRFAILDVPLSSGRREFHSLFPAHESPLPYPIYSPLAEFSSEPSNEKLYWERSHGHFTPLGCDIVGKGLANMIIQYGLLD